MSRQQHASLCPLAFAAALALSVPAHAQQSPYSIGVAQAFTHSSNIFQAPSDAARRATSSRRLVSDNISTTSLLAGVDQPIGRQRILADAAVRYNKYQDESQLDNASYRLSLGANWETVNRLSGTLSLVALQNLVTYGAESAFATSARITERPRQFDATVQYGGPAVLAVYGLYGHRSVEYSSSDASVNAELLDFKRDQVGAGVRYRVSGALTLGAEARTGKGEYPNRGDEFDRHDLSLTALWIPSGASRINARLTATKQDHDLARDISDATGSLLWSWQPTGKTRIETELRRDTGEELELLDDRATTTTVGDTSEVANRLQVRAIYEATAKIQLDGVVRYTRRSLIGPVLGVQVTGDDDTAFVSLGARYAVTRTISLGCSLAHENRETGSLLSYAYRVNTASCFAQLLLNP